MRLLHAPAHLEHVGWLIQHIVASGCTVRLDFIVKDPLRKGVQPDDDGCGLGSGVTGWLEDAKKVRRSIAFQKH